MKNDKLLLSFLAIPALLYAATAQAVCPVCVVAVGAGLGLSRWLGIDDSVSGLWIGAFIVILIVWTIAWLDKKNTRFRYRNFIVAAGWYIVTIVPLYFARIISHPYAFLCSCAHDKLILGIISGSAAFYFGEALYGYLKQKNNNRAYFPFQKVVMPVLPLVILTLLFYWLTK